MMKRILTGIAAAGSILLLSLMAQAQPGPMVGAWVGQGVDPNTGVAVQVQYTFMPSGQFQKSFAMQVGYSGGFDWIAGDWFTDGPLLRLEVRQHYATGGGNQGQLPPGELWYYEMPDPQTLVLTHALCVQQQLNHPDCRLVLTRAQ